MVIVDRHRKFKFDRRVGRQKIWRCNGIGPMPIRCDCKSTNQKCELFWAERYARRRYIDLRQIDRGRWRVRDVAVREGNLTRCRKRQVRLVENNISRW